MCIHVLYDCRNKLRWYVSLLAYARPTTASSNVGALCSLYVTLHLHIQRGSYWFINLQRSCYGSGGYSYVSRREGPGLIPVKPMSDLWLTKWHWARFFSEYFGSRLSHQWSMQIFILLWTTHIPVGRDSSVGIATRYRLDGPGFESRLGARFSAPVQTGLLYNWYRIFPGGKEAEVWRWPPTPI